jgi:hypothetical protein
MTPSSLTGSSSNPRGPSRTETAPTETHLTPDLVDLLAVLSLNGDAPSDRPADRLDIESGPERHVDGCGTCRAALDVRVAALLLERDAVAALVEDRCSEPALEAQRRGIFARLAARHDNGRVLEFPARAGKPARRDRPGVRWLAAAAAAGLFVGMLAGPRLQPVLGSPFFGRGHEGATRLVARTPTSTGDARLIHTHDEVFLSEMETAVNNRGALPLRALDDLTPEPVSANARSPR